MTQMPESQQPHQAATTIDQLKLEQFMQQARDEQNFGGGLLGGALAALVGACGWALITSISGYEIGIVALGVGYLVGFMIRKMGRGITKTYGVIGALWALIGCTLGKLLSACISIAQYEDIGLMEVLQLLDTEMAGRIMQSTFSPMDILFYAIAIYEGYRFSFRQFTEQEIGPLVKTA